MTSRTNGAYWVCLFYQYCIWDNKCQGYVSMYLLLPWYRWLVLLLLLTNTISNAITNSNNTIIIWYNFFFLFSPQPYILKLRGPGSRRDKWSHVCIYLCEQGERERERDGQSNISDLHIMSQAAALETERWIHVLLWQVLLCIGKQVDWGQRHVAVGALRWL